MSGGWLRDRIKPLSWTVLAAGVAVWAAGAAIFFRHPLLSQFDLVFGEGGDGRMLIFLHEHIYNALRGNAQFASPPFFYPQQGTLGFGPAFLLSSVPFAMLRALGCDPFLAFQLVLILLSFVCAMATLVVCVRYLQIRPSVAFCAVALIAFPNNLYVKAGIGHSNLLMLYFVPGIVALALWGLEDFPRIGARSIVRVALASALYALLFSTDVYSAWMFGLALLIAGGVVVFVLRRKLAGFVHDNARALTILLAAAAAGFLVAFIPFLLIYLPVRAIAPLRSYRDYVAFAPFPVDLFNVSQWNLIWGAVVERLIPGRNGQMLAVTPGLTVLTILLFVVLRRGSMKMERWRAILVAAAIGVWFFGWLLTMRIGTVSAFWLVRYLVPGALGIRVGMRLQLVANFWIVIALALLLEHWLKTAPDRIDARKFCIGAILVFCLIEQVNLMPNSRISRSHELAFLAAVPSPPAQCRAFYVVPQRRPDASYLDDTDAMMIAQHVGLPTLNGSSGWSPPGWNLQLRSADYAGLVRQWIGRSGLTEQVCSYDVARRQWALFR